jgi:hypothetical protein
MADRQSPAVNIPSTQSSDALMGHTLLPESLDESTTSNTCSQFAEAAKSPPLLPAPDTSIADNSKYPSEVRTNPVTNSPRNSSSASDSATPPDLVQSLSPAAGSSIEQSYAYALEVRQDLSSDRQETAFDASDATAPLNNAQNTLKLDTEPLTSGHRRNVSSISDFAYPPGIARNHLQDSEIHAPSHARNISGDNEFVNLSNITSNESLGSMQTTAVNTRRNSSVASDREDEEVDKWVQLRDIIAKARPGVIISINVYTVAPGAQTVLNEDGTMERIATTESETDESVSLKQISQISVYTEETTNRDQKSWKHILLAEAHAHAMPWKRLLIYIIDTTYTMSKVLGVLLGIAFCIGLVYICISGLAYLLDHFLPLQTPTDGTTTTPFQDAVLKPQFKYWQHRVMPYIMFGSIPFVFMGAVVWAMLEWAESAVDRAWVENTESPEADRLEAEMREEFMRWWAERQGKYKRHEI